MSNKVTGRLFITAGGITLNTKKGASIAIGGTKRTTVNGDRGTAGHSDEDVQGHVECTVIHKGDVPLSALNSMDDVTVSVVADTGVVWTGTHWWCLGDLKMTNGEAPCVFEGPPMTETKGA